MKERHPGGNSGRSSGSLVLQWGQGIPGAEQMPWGYGLSGCASQIHLASRQWWQTQSPIG